MQLFLLFLFFGPLGLHCFYAGRTLRGLTYLFSLLVGLICLGWPSSAEHLSNVGCFLLFGSLVVCSVTLLVLYLCDFVSILCGTFKDGDGNDVTRWA